MTKYTFNKNFFDEIDNEYKAYWLGFAWCDGTIVKRKRSENAYEYCFKVDLSEVDGEHLEKLKKSFNSNHAIKTYKGKTGFNNNYVTKRFSVYNKYLGEKMYYDYGMIPNRNDVSLVVSKIPEHLVKHFIRGVVDADGSLNYYTDGSFKKVSLSISTLDKLNNFVNEHLISIGLMKQKVKQLTRHEGKDGSCKTLHISGRVQSVNVLNYLYKDASIYLERKYQKYQQIIDFVK